MNPIYDFPTWQEVIDPAGEMPESEWTELSDLQRLALALCCFPDDYFDIYSLSYGPCTVRIFQDNTFVRWEIITKSANYFDGGNYLTQTEAIEGLVKAL